MHLNPFMLLGGVLRGTLPNPSFFGTVKVVFLTSGTTYTPSAGVRSLFVECFGGGGGGGGGVTGAAATSAASGGTGGSYSAKYLVAPLKASYTYAIGAAGTAGAAGNNAGGQGGPTTFDSPSVCSALGGAGGAGGGVAAASALIIESGTGTGFNGTQVGDILADAGYGTPSVRLSATIAIAGSGGPAPLGGMMQRGRAVQSAGLAGLQYGGGGSGGLSLNGGASVAGGAGNPGAIRIFEFF